MICEGFATERSLSSCTHSWGVNIISGNNGFPESEETGRFITRFWTTEGMQLIQFTSHNAAY